MKPQEKRQHDESQRDERTVELPPPVRRGDRIGVAALSSKIDPDRLATGLEALAAHGYEVVEARNLRSCCGLFAGSDGERLDAFHELASDPSLSAIIFARGGSGILRVLPGIDWDLLRQTPRAYVGYSDLTPFLLQVVERLGIASFHGPMIAGDFARGLTTRELDAFERALGGEELSLPVQFDESFEAIEGPLLGGCLSMLVSTLGTEYAPDFAGSLLVLEEVGEPLYRFDRMLTQLRLSGSLNSLKGVIVGHLDGEGGEPQKASPADSLLAQVREDAREFSWPLAWGLEVGHARPNMTLPLGLWSRLDPAAGRLQIGV